MTDKERIEEMEKHFTICVDKIPKSCSECQFYHSELSEYDGLYETCVWCGWDFGKEHCPLKTIQSVQNQKAVSALQKVKESIKFSVGIREYDIKEKDLYACVETVEFIDQLIKEYGGKE